MSAGFDLDLESAGREMREAQRLLESARGRIIHAQTLQPLPDAAVRACGGVITAIGIVECSGENLARVLSKPAVITAQEAA